MITFGLSIVAVLALLLTWGAAMLFEERKSSAMAWWMLLTGLVAIGAAFFAGIYQ